MTIVDELRAEVATALLNNRKTNINELLNILKVCDLEFRRLSVRGSYRLGSRSETLCRAIQRIHDWPGHRTADLLKSFRRRCGIVLKQERKSAQRLHTAPTRSG